MILNHPLFGHKYCNKYTFQDMRNIKKFANRAAYTAFRNSNEYVEPHLSVIEGEQKVVLNDITYDYTPKPLTFNIKSGGVIKWLRGDNGYGGELNVTLEYSKNGGTWTQIAPQEVDYYMVVNPEEYWMEKIIPSGGISVNAGDVVQFRALSNAKHTTLWDPEYSVFHTFYGSTCTFDVSGNIMSLISQDFENLTTLNGSFQFLFFECLIENSRKLILPATTLSDECYANMFKNCTNLVSTPMLPATTLANDCYSGMFKNCTKLKYAPKLPATTVFDSSYDCMFYGCTNLTSPPELPATTIGVY